MSKMFKCCEVDGCLTTSDNGRVYGKTGKFKMDLCDNHWAQMNTHGKILERTIYTPNRLIVNGDVLEIFMYNAKNIEVGKTIVDYKYYDKISKHKWGIQGNGYAGTIIDGKTIRLHRYITDVPFNMVVDHINHDRLDNRIANLRVCTSQNNSFNQPLSSNNTSGHTGVVWYTRDGLWQAHIMVSGKLIYLGRFINKDNAIKARNQGEIKYFGEYRNKKSVNL